MSRDCCVALPHGAMGLSEVCDCVISWSYSLFLLYLLGVCIKHFMLNAYIVSFLVWQYSHWDKGSWMLCALYSDFWAYSLSVCVPVSLSLGDICLSMIVAFPVLTQRPFLKRINLCWLMQKHLVKFMHLVKTWLDPTVAHLNIWYTNCIATWSVTFTKKYVSIS